ncbi:immunoglobulin-like domain-containing protein [Listeria sp. SHR_NRA_18]|nr:immunoglobulin-like domain-containing protein [Listeria sp. SHR_NRA_18]
MDTAVEVKYFYKVHYYRDVQDVYYTSQTKTLWTSQEVAESSVNNLFVDNDISKGIKPDLTQADLDAAQIKIDTMSDTTKKAELQLEIDKAQTEFTEQAAGSGAESAATTAVDNLFIDGKVKPDLTQADIDAAQAKIDAVTDASKKAELQAELDKAQAAINEKAAESAAQTAVDSLFIDGVAKADLSQADIDAAQAKIDAVTDTAKKAELQAELDKATTAFNVIAPTTISALTTDSVKVTGSGEPNAPVTIKNGTTTIGTGTVKADGTFEVTIAKQAVNATITATVTKASNGKKATASTTVKQGIDYSLTANSYKMGDTKLTGTVGKNVSRVRLWINGKPVVQGVINADGTYEFPTAANFIKLVGDTVEVVAVDSNYVEVNRKTVTVTGTSTFDNALTVAKFNTGDTKITGTFGKDIKKVRLSINGKSVTQATTTAAGTFEIANVDKFITSPLDLVEIVGVDDQYNVLNRKTVSLPGSDTYENTFSVDNYFIGQNTLGGSYGQHTAYVRLWVNGEVKKQADLNPADNTFKLKGIFGFIKSKTDVAEIVYVDAQYKVIQRVAVTVK